MRKDTVLGAFVAMTLCAGAASAAGGVKGKATFSGASKSEPVKMSADPKCAAQHEKGFKFESVQVGAGGGLANVFIYVKKGLEGKSFPAPAEPKVILDQKGCWYDPHVLGVMVGQKVQIKNSDPTMHNVNAQPDFNAAMPAGIPPMEKTFKKPKIMFPIKCNVHPWMKTYVGIVEHPYYSVTGKDGSYQIKDLPPGKYTLEAWHEKLGQVTQDVTVSAGGSSADFKFSGGK